MNLFILAIFAFYGGMHAYAFIRGRNVFGFGAGPGIALALFMVAMTVAPFLIRALELHAYERTARAYSYLAYTWMALLFLFFCGSLVLDLIGLMTRAGGWVTRADVSAFLISSRTAFSASLALSLAICGYGYFEARDIRTERLRIETRKLPPGIDRLVIAQISDVHLGLIIQRSRLEKILALVNAEHPDVFVATGDLVDAQINQMTGLAEMLRAVPAPFGKFAVMGNHEYYAGPEKAIAFIREAGFSLLRNEAKTDGPITLVGFDDRTGVQLNLRKPASEKELLAKLSQDRFILVMKHQPLIDSPSVGLFDLQISGHTHKGQIFPFTLLTLLSYPLNAGRYELGKGSVLNVSRGTGTWGPPIRFFAPPEVTVCEIVRKSAP